MICEGYNYCTMVLTAGLDVTQVHPDLRVQREAPWRLHLAPWVTTEVMTSPELGVVLGQVVTVRVLRGPWLAVLTGHSDADCAPVVRPTSIVAAVVCGRIFGRDNNSVWTFLLTT